MIWDKEAVGGVRGRSGVVGVVVGMEKEHKKRN